MSLDIGGAETHIVNLAKNLSEDYDIIVASNGGTYVEELEKNSIKHYKVPLNSKKISHILKSISKIKKLIDDEKIDIIHSHARIPSFIAGLICKRKKIHFVSTTHAHFRVNFLLRKLSNWGEYSIAVSQDLKDYLVEEYNFDESKVFLSINGIDTKIFNPKENTTKDKITHVSRLDEDTSDVAKILVRNAKDIFDKTGLKIKIVGDGSEFPKIKSLADKVDPESKFIILSGASNSVHKELEDAKVFVGLSRALLEAMAYNIRVILAGNSGYAGLVKKEELSNYENDNFTGRNFPELDENELLNALIQASTETHIEDYSWTRDYIENKYSVEIMAKPYKDLYNKIFNRNKSYLISGYYGYRNSGDDALLTSVVKDIFEINPKNKVTILSKKNTTYDFENVEFVDRFSLKAVRKAIKKSDILIMGGGSLLQDKTSNRSLYYYLGIMSIANKFKKKCYLYANGIGPIDKKINRHFSKKILDKVYAITFRDKDSYDFVRKIGVSKPNMLVTADSVFSLEADFKATKKIDNKVAFVIRDWENSDKFSIELAKFADYLNETHALETVFIPLKLGDDENISKKIISLMKNDASMLILDNEKALIEFFSTCYFTVCMRFHGVIYSSIASSIPIGLSYDKKVSSICESLEIDYMLTDEINFEKLKKTSLDIIENYDIKKLAMSKNVEKLKEKAKINKEVLREL